MKNIFIVLVIIASGYLLITQTKVGEHVSEFMPDAQFEKLNENLTTKLDGLISESLERSLENKLPELTFNLKADLQESLNTLLDERGESFMINNDKRANIHLTNNEELQRVKELAQEKDVQIKVLSEKLDNLSLLVNTLTQGNEHLNAPEKSENYTVGTALITNTESSSGFNNSTHVDARVSHTESVNINEQRKLTLQRISSQMNQQTLSLLTN